MNTDEHRYGLRMVVLESMRAFVHSWGPAWLLWILLPMPAILFWRSHDGRFIALCCFFVSCTGFVVSVFKEDFTHLSTRKSAVRFEPAAEVWRRRMFFLRTALLFHWAIFSVLCVAFNDAHDFMAPVLAFLTLIPTLCIAPYIAMATQKLFVSIVLTVFLVGSMKLVAGVMTVLVYGWDASAHGHTALTWMAPNLITSSLAAATAVLSATFHLLGRRRFLSSYERVRKQ